MKTIINKMYLLLTAIIFLVVGCNEKDYSAEDLDFSPTVVVEQPTAIYKNSPVKMKLKINSENESVLGDMAVTYSVTDGDGYIRVDNEEVAPGVEFRPTLDGSAMPFYYYPSKAGKQTLTFKLKSVKSSRTASLDVLVEEIYYKIAVENMPAEPKLGRKESFDVIINFANTEDSPIKTCKATATITKGVGKVEYNGVELSTKPIEMTLGRNTLSYTSSVRGENVIQLNLQAENGYVQPVYIPVMIGAPDFSISLVKEENPSIAAGKDYSFAIEVKEDGQDPTNTYTIAYRFIKNNGTIKINNKDVEVGGTEKAVKGSNVIVYNGFEGGDADIEFIVKDSYNTERKINVQFTLAFGKIAIVAEKLGDAVELETTLLDLVIKKMGYTGKYELSCNIMKGSAKVYWKDAEISTDGNWNVNFSTSEVVNIKPLAGGELQLRFKVKDSKSDISEPILVTYDVKPQESIVVTTTGVHATEIGKAVDFKLKAEKLGFSGKFVTSYKYLAGNGTLSVANLNRAPNTTFDLVAGETNMSFVPQAYGNNTIEFTISDGLKERKFILNIECVAVIKLSSSDSEVTFMGAGNYTIGSTCTISAAHPTLVFNGWYKGDIKVAETATYSFIVNENNNLIARFTLPTNIITANQVGNNLVITAQFPVNTDVILNYDLHYRYYYRGELEREGSESHTVTIKKGETTKSIEWYKEEVGYDSDTSWSGTDIKLHSAASDSKYIYMFNWINNNK